MEHTNSKIEDKSHRLHQEQRQKSQSLASQATRQSRSGDVDERTLGPRPTRATTSQCTDGLQQQLRQNRATTSDIRQQSDSAAPDRVNRTLEEGKYRTALQQKQVEIAEIREQWREEVASLRKREEQLTQDKKDLSIKISHLEMARDMRSTASAGDPMELELYFMNKQVYELEQKIQMMQGKMRFISGDGDTLADSASNKAPKLSTVQWISCKASSTQSCMVMTEQTCSKHRQK
ncbi:uncharacterized protein LY89DRAFT_689926 [Mollisia scopiformis]|uniref:Uncharacterized protein n=1 Tax=Mollisia scopiformis TaxID=149040 RepID=A0A132BCG9_MOLSC|nr:uncharacterized protein LY89DRAFT_689926 [Mollisia scopiformis]KUJ10086.1 hypothetical protein LY89DRAFT_689926 [Mollisia scopiformis]